MKKAALIFSVLVFLAMTGLISFAKEGSEGEEMKSSYPAITGTIRTTKGDIQVKLFPDQAPLTVLSFVNLSKRGFYDNLTFHRVIPNFVIQGGCPLGTGTGGPGYRFKDEFSPELRHSRPGILSMANAGPNTNGSQFFVTHVPTPHLDDRHSVFGEVQGPKDQEVVDSIVVGDRINTIVIEGDYTQLAEDHKQDLQKWNQVLDKK